MNLRTVFNTSMVMMCVLPLLPVVQADDAAATTAPAATVTATQPSRPAPPDRPLEPRHLNLSRFRVAMGGYDLVSYYSGKPVEGSPAISLERGGAIYRFANAENRRAFDDHPEKYHAAYGGWCAFGMSRGRKVEPDALNFKIRDGMVFLFYRDNSTDKLALWNRFEKHCFPASQSQWVRITGVANAMPGPKPPPPRPQPKR